MWNQICEWRNGEDCVFRGALQFSHVYEVAVLENRPHPLLKKASCNDSFLSFFLALFVWPLLPAHCRCRGLFLHFITLNDPHTSCRTPLDKWSTRRRKLYMTTHNTYKKQTAMLPAGFEPAIPGSDRLQIHALDRAATGSGFFNSVQKISWKFYCSSCRKLGNPNFF